MMFVFEMPEVGEGVVEAEIAEWKVAVGDVVALDQPLCEITTDKASLEISSPKSGVIRKLCGEPGDIIQVHTPLVEIELGAEGASTAPAPVAVPEPAAPAPAAAKASEPAPAAPAASDPATRSVTKATPAVRRHARERDIDLARVPGTGPGGRITHSDLDAFATPRPAAATITTTPPGAKVFVDNALQSRSTPLTISGLQPGVIYNVRVARDGYEPVSQPVQLPKNRSLTWRIPLRRSTPAMKP